MKISKAKLQEIVKEELADLIKEGFVAEDQVEEGIGNTIKKGLAGLGAAATMATSSPAIAGQPAQSPASAETISVQSKTVSENTVQTIGKSVTLQKNVSAHYIKSVEEVMKAQGKQVKGITTTFDFQEEINGKLTTVNLVTRKQGGKVETQLVINGRTINASNLEGQDLQTFLDSLTSLTK